MQNSLPKLPLPSEALRAAALLDRKLACSKRLTDVSGHPLFILGSAKSRVGLSTNRPGRYPPQVAPSVGVLWPIEIEEYRHVAGDFSQVPRETDAQVRADRPTMKRLQRTLDAIPPRDRSSFLESSQPTEPDQG
jgi:hypothetical protein